MGTGISVKCQKCGKEFTRYEGTGFAFTHITGRQALLQ